MTAIAQHPELQYSLIIDYIDLVSSHYEAGPLQSTLPSYNGPQDERIERILKALAKLAKRAYTAEDMLAQVRAAENVGPETKKRRSVDIPETIQSIESSMSNYNGFTNNKPGPSVFFTDLYQPTFPTNGARDTPSSVSDSDTEMMVDRIPTCASVTTDSTVNGKELKRAGSPMSISLDGLNPLDSHRFDSRQYSTSAGIISWSAPSSSHATSVPCPTCGRSLGETAIFSRLHTYTGTGDEGSPLVVPPGPLVAAAFESGLSAVEELRLLKAQVQDVARVCNAVARGDLSQKITVPVQGVVMVQLKDVINTMVCQVRIMKRVLTPVKVENLGKFAKEVTRVSQEVGTEGKLGGQALVLDVEGTWRELTGTVNKLAANLTSQVRSIATVTKAVALGDLSKQIDVDARGEILDLKNTVNGMVVRLRTLAAEVTRVTLEVGSQGKLGGQANVPDVEGVWLELTRNVSGFVHTSTQHHALMLGHSR